MSANRRDIDRAMEEGAQILFLSVPQRVVSNEAGMVTHLEYIRMEPNDEGKDKYIPIPNSQTLIDADLLVAALERKPDLSCLYDKANNCRFEITKDQTLAADEDTLQTTIPHVFAAGDIHTGRASVIKAIGGGRRAARSIHYYITEGTIPVPENLQRKVIPESILRQVEVPEYIPRVRIQEIPVEVRRNSFTEEVKGSITDVQALLEASRCLQCGSICYDHDKDLESQTKGRLRKYK
jgi:NADPH-dependent glutamate synthase beta subunit-like oxidoreductase